MTGIVTTGVSTTERDDGADDDGRAVDPGDGGRGESSFGGKAEDDC